MALDASPTLLDGGDVDVPAAPSPKIDDYGLTRALPR